MEELERKSLVWCCFVQEVQRVGPPEVRAPRQRILPPGVEDRGVERPGPSRVTCTRPEVPPLGGAEVAEDARLLSRDGPDLGARRPTPDPDPRFERSYLGDRSRRDEPLELETPPFARHGDASSAPDDSVMATGSYVGDLDDVAERDAEVLNLPEQEASADEPPGQQALADQRPPKTKRKKEVKKMFAVRKRPPIERSIVDLIRLKKFGLLSSKILELVDGPEVEISRDIYQGILESGNDLEDQLEAVKGIVQGLSSEYQRLEYISG